MVLTGAAVLLLAWSVEPAIEAPGSRFDVRDVDLDDSARILVTTGDTTIFDTPLRPLGVLTGTGPAATTGGADTDRDPSGDQRGGSDPGTRPDPVGGGGTSTPTPTTSTPTTPVPTTPTPTTDGGTSTGGGSVVDPVPDPIPTPTPTPPAGAAGSGIKVVVAGTTATSSSSSTSTETTVAAGSTSAAIDTSTSTSTATVTAGGITLTLPPLGIVHG